MTTLIASMWRYRNHATGVLQALATDPNISRIILFAQHEYDFYTDSRFKKMAEYSELHNIPFYCIANISDPDQVITGYQSVKIVPWKTYWFSSTLKLSSSNPSPAQEITFPYICMNRRAHKHRCALMDRLAKYDVIDKGAVSWLRLNIDEITREEKFDFTYWTPALMKLTDSPVDPLTMNVFNVPGEYYQSFMHLVTETSGSFNVVTEKTVLPLLLKKPFLVLGGINNHMMLQDYGFKLYDEIFDYSYATLPDLNDRCDALAKQVASISNKTPSELSAMRELIGPKLEFNAALAHKLSIDLSYVPELILDAYKDPANIYCSRDIVEFILSRQA